MKPLVIYHANCADGFGAAFAAWRKLGDDAEYLPLQYGDVKAPKKLPFINNRDVYILDFSLPKEVMNWLFDNAGRVVWLDHHKTAFEMWCDNGEKDYYHAVLDDRQEHHITLDNNKSGAMLAWEHFHPKDEVPKLIKHIDDYDRWQFKIDGTKMFNKALWSYSPWSFEEWKHWVDLSEKSRFGLQAFYNEGETILRAHNQNVQSVIKGSARECAIRSPDGMPDFVFGLAANCPPHLTSDVGHELAKKSGTFGLCWTLSKEGLIANCSLRSNGDYDVSPIAKAFGGGGHKNAAGFEAPIHELLGWLK